jgi:hypothetical protein
MGGCTVGFFSSQVAKVAKGKFLEVKQIKSIFGQHEFATFSIALYTYTERVSV